MPYPTVLRLARNTRGRDLVIGDIHGHFARVERELARVGFEPTRDRLICVGDLVDRGPASERAAEWLARPWFHAVRGNHDAALLHRCGRLGARFELWHDYHQWFEALPEPEQRAVLEALDGLPWALEIETTHGAVGVVHAEVPESQRSWREFCAELEHDEFLQMLAVSNRVLARAAAAGHAQDHAALTLPDISWVVHGHTPLPDCGIGRLGNRLWIDTMGWHARPEERPEARFTLVDVEDPVRPL